MNAVSTVPYDPSQWGRVFQKEQQNKTRWEKCMLVSLNKVQRPSLKPNVVVHQ